MLLLFIARHVAVLALLLLAAAGAGSLAAGAGSRSARSPREGIALRSALGLALCAHTLFFLGIIGQLRVVPLMALTLVAIILLPMGEGAAILLLPSGEGARRADEGRGTGRKSAGEAWIVVAFAPLFVLALYPPIAFDETLYHLPFVRGLARAGALRVLPDVRFPVFPQFQELLCVPPLLLAGDVATHLVSLAEIIVAAALLIEWGRRYQAHAGWLATALLVGSPIVVQIGTVLYVDAALMLFVLAGFYALDRERFALAGFFFGTACDVKYLGGYFALAALIVVIHASTWKRALVFAATCAAAALPTTAWIAFHTHDPLFPFLRRSAWSMPLSLPVPWSERLIGTIRVIWDVTFARARMNFQPPVTPLLIGIVLCVAIAAVRDARARSIALIGLVYLAVFSFLPQDTRYLLPLLPLFAIVAAVVLATRWPKAVPLLALLAVAPGVAYAGYRLALQGIPPSTYAERVAWLTKRVPEYRALVRPGTERIYVYGGEQLKDYAAGELLGDFFGPHSYTWLLSGGDSTSAIAQRLRTIDVRWFLVAKRRCAPPRVDGGMELVYEDDAAQLWRVQR